VESVDHPREDRRGEASFDESRSSFRLISSESPIPNCQLVMAVNKLILLKFEFALKINQSAQLQGNLNKSLYPTESVEGFCRKVRLIDTIAILHHRCANRKIIVELSGEIGAIK
jgi:hypothetical protein